MTEEYASYCTGLLLARRVLEKLKMDDEYKGNVEAAGEDYSEIVSLAMFMDWMRNLEVGIPALLEDGIQRLYMPESMTSFVAGLGSSDLKCYDL
ncbi:hypothetical protein ACET3Z_021415 [Daucus carota]